MNMPLCTCGHGKFADHPWDGREYAHCICCQVCRRHHDDHDFAAHRFQVCPCTQYQASTPTSKRDNDG